MTRISLNKCVSIVALLLLAGSAGCSKGAEELAKERRASLQLDAAPNIPKMLNIAFGDQVTLLGYKVDPAGPVHAKDKLKVTFYWRLDKPLESGWRLSSRLVGERGQMLANLDNSGPLRERRGRKQVLPPSSWEMGKIYVDTQIVRIPRKIDGKSVALNVAIRKGDASLPPKSKLPVQRGYLKAVELPVEVLRKPMLVPQLVVPQVDSSQSIQIDGKLDEAAWATAASLPNLVTLDHNQAPAENAPNRAAVKFLWNEESLFLALDVRDSDLVGGYKKTAKDVPLWRRDAFEILFKFDEKADNKHYYRIATGPLGQLFDSAYADFEVPADGKTEALGDTTWSSAAKVATVLKGTPDDAADKDEGYVQEIEIPWASFPQERFTPKADAAVWTNFAVHSGDQVVGFSPYFRDLEMQSVRRFGKLLLAPTGTPPVVSRVPSLTSDLPPALVAARAAAKTALAEAKRVAAAAAKAAPSAPSPAPSAPSPAPSASAAPSAPSPAPSALPADKAK